MDYVTDTHSIVWYFTEDIHLSKKALDIFEGTIKEGTIIVPAVVLAEIMFISKKGKINLTFKETLNKIKEYENFELNGKPLLSYLQDFYDTRRDFADFLKKSWKFVKQHEKEINSI